MNSLVSTLLNPNPVGILARNLTESSKILQCTFGNMPLSSKCTTHFRWSFIFSTDGLYILPGSNFVPFEEVKVPVSKSADFFLLSAPWRILEDLGWLGFMECLHWNIIFLYGNKNSVRGLRLGISFLQAQGHISWVQGTSIRISECLWEQVWRGAKAKARVTEEWPPVNSRPAVIVHNRMIQRFSDFPNCLTLFHRCQD